MTSSKSKIFGKLESSEQASPRPLSTICPPITAPNSYYPRFLVEDFEERVVDFVNREMSR
jgi:hypothetical protein